MISRPNNHQNGLTLVELMIALAISLFLLLGITQLFSANKASYDMTEAHARLQENARFALDIMSRDIRSAGYSGCRPVDRMDIFSVAQDPVPAIMGPTTILFGREAVDNNSWNIAPDGQLGAVVGGTDILVLQRASSCGGNLVANMADEAADIQIYMPNSCGLADEDVVMIADCLNAHIFRVSDVVDNLAANTQTISHAAGADFNTTAIFCNDDASAAVCDAGEEKAYSYDSEILQFQAFTYFIRNGVSGTPSLWRYNHNRVVSASNPVELIEGIEDMQIVYGLDNVDNDDVIDEYQDAENIENNAQWDQVISARISLLAHTLEDNITIEDQAIVFNGENIPGDDGKLRRIFTSTIGIRNRVQ
jgi:type IV pilus assembly protein PilW